MRLPEIGGSWLKSLRWLFYLALALVGAYVVWKHWSGFLTWLARILDELRGLWESFFGRRRAAQPPPAPSEPLVRPPSFAEFPNPFTTGAARIYTPADLVRYTFDAVQAWAREMGMPREPFDTPLEFADALEHARVGWAEEMRLLAAYYSQVTYSQAALRPASVESVERLWQRLDATAPAAAWPA